MNESKIIIGFPSFLGDIIEKALNFFNPPINAEVFVVGSFLSDGQFNTLNQGFVI